jgi:DNA replication protein DnaC
MNNTKPCQYRVEKWRNKVGPDAYQSLLPMKIREGLKLNSPEMDTKSVSFLMEPDQGNCLYLFGKVGSGKSLKAACLLMECLRIGFTHKLGLYSSNFAFVSVPKLLQEIKATFSKDYVGPSEKEISDYYSTVQFLVLDDIATEKTTEWTLQVLYVIVDSRYNNLKPTIFTSNLDLNQLAIQFGSDRIPSRINGMCRQLKVGDKDLRKRR